MTLAVSPPSRPAFPAPSSARLAARALRLAPLFAACAAAMAGAYAAGEAARRGAADSVPASNPVAAVMSGRTVPRLALKLAPAPLLRGALADARDLECLTQAVYYEARGEPEGGQAAVAQVVLNRTRAGRYPASVCGVVFQHARAARRADCQFSFACDTRIGRPRERAAWARAEHVARAALAGRRAAAVGGATQFRVAGLAAAGLQRVAQIGAHVFYRPGKAMRPPPPALMAAPPAQAPASAAADTPSVTAAAPAAGAPSG